jgi:mRNA-degrading endonuclease RelE of RelBE toxin-antitoxin system
MTFKTVFSSTAAREIKNSYIWYEDHSNGLGDRFVNSIDLILELIQQNPVGFPNKKGSYREASLKKFPYQIVYEYIEETQTIYVLHVFHTKRNPRIKHKHD